MSSESKRKGPKSKIALFSSAIASNQIVQLSLVVVLAIAIRVVYLLQYKANAPYYSIMIVDSRYYDEWAQRVAAGKGYGPMPFYMAPLYPYFLAILYKIFGHNFTPIYILQAALGIVNACLVYVLGRKLFGHLSGLIAMLLILFYAPLVYLEAKILTETLAIAINLCSILLLMRAIERPSAGRFLGAGILLGVSAVCRPNSLITIGLFIAWLWLFGRRMARFYTRQLFPLIIGVVLAIAPVTARNYFIGNDLVLITSNGGIVFAQANNEAANGVSSAMAGFSASIMTQQQEEMAIASRALGHQVKPSESAAFWFRQGLTFIRDHPGRFIRLLALKLLWSLHDVEARCSFNVYLE
ncbi:MAG: glycosyltransferase family 39 protein, partial [Armatimonadota bacterium]|nr:glycosyltransferase family 39 protein [Armatimonadota bacterium]